MNMNKILSPSMGHPRVPAKEHRNRKQNLRNYNVFNQAVLDVKLYFLNGKKVHILI